MTFVCPHCNGTGFLQVLVCPGAKVANRECDTCLGSGFISAERQAKIEAGKAMRAERLARYVTQRARAAELGMDEVAYSRLENGRD